MDTETKILSVTGVSYNFLEIISFENPHIKSIYLRNQTIINTIQNSEERQNIKNSFH